MSKIYHWCQSNCLSKHNAHGDDINFYKIIPVSNNETSSSLWLCSYGVWDYIKIGYKVLRVNKC